MSKIRINNWNNKTIHKVVFLCCFIIFFLFFLVRSQLKMFENSLEELCSLENLNDKTEIKLIPTEHNVINRETSNKDL